MRQNHVRSRLWWDRWNAESGPRYPQEKVIQFCLRSFPTIDARTQRHALDWGCGNGVNTEFLCAEGFRVTATDWSPVAIESTRERLAARSLSAELINEDLESLSLPQSSVDLVICTGVFDTTGMEKAAAALKKLWHVLRTGARGMFLFAEVRDARVISGNLPGFRGYSRDEVERLFADFVKVDIDQYITTYGSGKEMNCDWLITIEG